MNYLAIDTSGAHLSVVACHDDTTVKIYLPDCALRHSVVLMDTIDEALESARLRTGDCDFFAAVVGPGSFTGIRIGISTVKGLCFAASKPALAVTSFDCIAYHKTAPRVLSLVDAGKGFFYACGYEDEKVVLPPAYLSKEETMELIGRGFAPAALSPLLGGTAVDPAEGLRLAVLAKKGEVAPASALHALYLRKSSAEEHRS